MSLMFFGRPNWGAYWGAPNSHGVAVNAYGVSIWWNRGAEVFCFGWRPLHWWRISVAPYKSRGWSIRP